METPKIETKPEGADFDKLKDQKEVPMPYEPKKPNWLKRHTKQIWISVLIIVIGLISWWAYNSIVEKNKKYDALFEKYANEQSLAEKRAATIDSTMRVIKILSKYRGLTDAMYYRDSVRLPFKYRPGVFAYLKVDSSRVLITDMITGGDLNNYYFKYRVQDCKTKEFFEMSPDLIY